ncbi:MAG: ABC transporter substrate-binding protein [Dehalococcoidia bacterium]|jgi:hypothetical protein
MSTRKILAVIAISLALIILPAALSACGNLSSTLTGKPETVVIYHFGDLSQLYAPATSSKLSGFADFAAWYNQEMQGVDGVPITYKYIDTGGKLDEALTAYQIFKQSKPYPSVMVLSGTEESVRLQRNFTDDGILCFTSGTPGIYPIGYELATIPTYSDSLGAFVMWLSDDWTPRTGQKAKLAILTWDSPYGKAVINEEVREFIAARGIELVYEDVFKTDVKDVTPQMQKIREADANWVYDNTLGQGPIIISSAAESLNMLEHELYSTEPGKVHRATGPWGIDEASIILGGPLMEGLIGPRSIASWSMSEVEGVVKALTAFDKNNRQPSERTIGYLNVWPITYTIGHCMNQVVKEQGWEKLNGITLREEFLKLKDFKPLGMTVYSFSDSKPAPDQTMIFKIERGRLLPITDWITCPDLRPKALR